LDLSVVRSLDDLAQQFQNKFFKLLLSSIHVINQNQLFRITALFPILLFLHFTISLAQSYSHKIEQVPIKGEFDNTIGTCILQDNAGFMWFGTTSGLYRFDGIKYKSYRQEPFDSSSLSSDNITCLIEDSDGIIWIGTGNGLNRFDKGTETFKQYLYSWFDSTTLIDNSSNLLLEDSEGHIWIATPNGFSRFNRTKEEFKNFVFNPVELNMVGDPNNIWWMYLDKSDYLWLQYGDNGLCRFDMESETFDEISNAPCDLMQMYEDKSGRFWITSWCGLFLFDRVNKTFTKHLHEPDNPHRLNNQMVRLITEDIYDNIWIRTYDGWYQYNQNLELLYNWKYPQEYTRSTPYY